MIGKAVFLFAICIGVSQGLRSDELAMFGTTGEKEQNTGLVGWVKISVSGSEYIIESNGIPDHDTADWPGQNPNEIIEKDNTWYAPVNPAIAAQPSCLGMGAIAVATNGLPMFNPWTNEANNAVEGDTAEWFDMCDGHPSPDGSYHYHKQPSSCLFSVTPGVPSPMIGIAFDGFAIYGPNDENGNTLTSADLDECHGRINEYGVYQYHATSDFPYLLGCYKGTPSRSSNDDANCYFARDADENGNIGGGGGQPPCPPGGCKPPPHPGRR